MYPCVGSLGGPGAKGGSDTEMASSLAFSEDGVRILVGKTERVYEVPRAGQFKHRELGIGQPDQIYDAYVFEPSMTMPRAECQNPHWHE